MHAAVFAPAPGGSCTCRTCVGSTTEFGSSTSTHQGRRMLPSWRAGAAGNGESKQRECTEPSGNAHIQCLPVGHQWVGVFDQRLPQQLVQGGDLHQVVSLGQPVHQLWRTTTISVLLRSTITSRCTRRRTTLSCLPALIGCACTALSVAATPAEPHSQTPEAVSSTPATAGTANQAPPAPKNATRRQSASGTRQQIKWVHACMYRRWHGSPTLSRCLLTTPFNRRTKSAGTRGLFVFTLMRCDVTGS